MKKLVSIIVVLAALLGAAPAQAHLPYRPEAPGLKARLASQARNIAHVEYVCEYGAGYHKRWSCATLRNGWLTREHRETIAALRPRVPTGGTPTQNVALGRHMASAYGWGVGYEWQALYDLWNHESGWSQYADNPSSDACGIPQRMNACEEGHDPRIQISWGLAYIKGRYGSPSAALHHLRTHNYY